MKLIAKTIALVASCMLLFFHASFAQDKTLNGKITNSDGTAIQGVTIQEKGTKNFTVSNAEGNYSLRISKADAIVIFSFVGYATQQTKATSDGQLNITLLPGDQQLNEVVVTALGIKKEVKRIGYATQEVKGADLIKARDPNAINSLAGKVAGLSVGANAEMLGRPNVVLRGNADLLYVVDGVPINSDSWNISADDIESYNVLKGPNAAALYGFRGQNGAIVITTKRGTKDKKGWTVTFNSSNTIEKGFLAIADPQTEYGRGGTAGAQPYTYQYASGYGYGAPNSAAFLGNDLLYDNQQRQSEWGPRFEGQLLKQYDGPYDPIANKRTPTPYLARGKDNLKNFLEAGFLSTDNVSASASGENYDIRMSYSHTYQKGTAPNTKLNLDNLNLITSYRLTPKLTVEANMNFNTQYTPNIPDQAYGPNSFVYEFSVYGSADFDVRSLKNYYQGPQGVPNLQQYNNEYGRANNPYFQSDKWLRGHYKNDFYGYIKGTYKFTDDLNLSLRSQVTTWNQSRTEKVPASANLNTYLIPGWYDFGKYNGDYREDNRSLIENNTDAILSFNKQVGDDWNISALAGGSWRSFKYNSVFQTTRNLSVPNVFTFQNTTTNYIYNWGSNMQVYSGFYSVDLGFRKFFTVSTTGRVDNSSTLPAGNRTFFYPSVALSTVLSDYLKMPDWVSFAKLRGSWADVKSGLTQSTVPTAYQQITGLSTNSGLLHYGSELTTTYDGPSYANQLSYANTSYYNNTQSINYSASLPNPNIKPADNKSYEVGADVRLFKSKLGISATYFVSDAGPQIYQGGVDNATGFQTLTVNGVVTQKKGWELTVNASPLKSVRGLNWNVLVNWSTYVERLKSIYGTETGLTINGHTYSIGERMDAYYGAGFVRDQEGNIIYGYDQAKKVASGTPLQNPSTSLADKKFLGYMNPDFVWGIVNTFSYRSWSLSFQFDGRMGGKIYDRVYLQMTNGGTAADLAGNTKAGQARLKEWKSTNGGANAPTPAYVGTGKIITDGTATYSKGIITNEKDLKFADNTQATTVQNYFSNGVSGGNQVDEYYMISRTFAKLREVTLSYSIPSKVLGKSFIKGASFSLVGRNLLYFAARKDFDIDQYASGYNFSNNALIGTGTTDLQSPTARRYGANINLTF